jgi:hypothetical protein
LDEAVVSAGALAGRLDGIGRVIVRRGAVITPAARDLFRQQKIDVSVRIDTNHATKTTRLLIGAADTSFRSHDLIQLLFRKPVTIEQIAESDLIGVIEQLAHQLTDPAALGLLLTAQAAAAACLANRLRGVRAVAAGDNAAIASAVRQVGANLLVVDPAHRSPFALKQLVERYIHGGPRSCPEQWRGRLN